MDKVNLAVLLRDDISEESDIVSSKEAELDKKNKEIENKLSTSLFNNEMITFNTKYRKPW